MSIKYIPDLMPNVFHINSFFRKHSEKGNLHIKNWIMSSFDKWQKTLKKSESCLIDSTVTWSLKSSLQSHLLPCFLTDNPKIPLGVKY